MSLPKPVPPSQANNTSRMSTGDRLFTVAVVVIVVACGVAILFPDFIMPRPRLSRRTACNNNLKQIGLALWTYHDVHGELPPAYFADDEGVPTHSWRVMLLPFLEEQGLYDQYDFSKPWNSTDNLKLAELMPEVFRCPGDQSEFVTVTTTYVAVVGKETAWPFAESRSDSDFRDGLSNTLVVIESRNSRTHWMAPRDSSFSLFVPVDESGRTQFTSAAHESGFYVVYGDIRVEFLPSQMSCDELRAMLTIAGDEPVTAR